MSESRCWGVIPAAGSGSRMAAGLPKQYLEVAGKPLIRHALEALLQLPDIAGVCVAVQAGDHRARALASEPRTRLIRGGATRADSVLAALEALAEQAAPEDWVLVHDAARPCLSQDDLQCLVERVGATATGALLALPVVDTLKRVDAQGRVQATVPRADLWRAQTPQMFRLGELKLALERALAAGVEVTDEASAMEWAGHPVQVVAGDPRNIKVTVPADLALARLYLTEAATA